MDRSVDEGKLPAVAIVVTALNDARRIGDCLTSLVRQDYPASRREIIVADRGSTDRTREVAADLGARCVDALRLNVSAARNAGIAASRAEIVAFTDPDCVAGTRWLDAMAGEFADASVGGVCGAIVPFPPRTMVERYAARLRSHSPERAIRHRSHPFGLAPNLALRREALQGIGGFDVRFPGGGWEDADLCWRLKRATAYRLVFASRATVFHRYRSTPFDFFVQHYRYGYGLALLRRKYESELPPARPRNDGASFPSNDVPGIERFDREWLVFNLLAALRRLGQHTGRAVGALAGP